MCRCQYIFTNRPFDNGGFSARLQGADWQNVAGGLNCYLNAIENFNPSIKLAIDPHRWIPQEVCYDLFDNRNDAAFGGTVVDNVAAYTNQQCFNALQSDVRSILTFKSRLLQQNGNNQAANANALFTQYGY